VEKSSSNCEVIIFILFEKNKQTKMAVVFIAVSNIRFLEREGHRRKQPLFTFLFPYFIFRILFWKQIKNYIIKNRIKTELIDDENKPKRISPHGL
jgi:hypothetical protein